MIAFLLSQTRSFMGFDGDSSDPTTECCAKCLVRLASSEDGVEVVGILALLEE